MSFNLKLESDDYTIKKALTWGMCGSHFSKAAVEIFWLNRVVHVGVGLLEILPVVGQIISLLELGVISFFFRPPTPSKPLIPPTPSQPLAPPLLPEPASRYPVVTLVKNQESDKDVARYWPTDLTILGITEEQKELIDTTIRDAWRFGSFKWNTTLRSLTYGSKTVQLPISFGIDPNNYDLLFLTKKPFALDGKIKSKLAYNVRRGQFLTKSRITGIFESTICQYMSAKRTERRVANFYSGSAILDKHNKVKEVQVESMREGPISVLFGTEPLATFATKQHLILDLLEDLYALHTRKVEGDFITFTLLGFSTEIPLRNFSHSNICFDTASVFKEQGMWRGVLSAFKNIGMDLPSLGFTPPEYVKFYQNKLPNGFDKMEGKDKEALIRFSVDHGQERDIWAMGLVILTTLVGRAELVFGTKMAPLPCLKRCIQQKGKDKYDEGQICNLKQETLDSEIEMLKQEVMQKHPETVKVIEVLFASVKQMLRIDPNERKSVASLFREIKISPLFSSFMASRLPKPKSCRPTVTLVKHQETETDTPRFWPTDLTLLGITETQKQEIDTHLSAASRVDTFNLYKKELEYNGQFAHLPIAVAYDPNNFQFILLPKTVFVRSGERKIKWAYNLATGEFLLKKRVLSNLEKLLTSFMCGRRKARGIDYKLIWRNVEEKSGERKLQRVEPLRDGTPAILFGTDVLANVSNKRTIFQDLLADLSDFHSAKVTGIGYTSDDGKTTTLPEYPAFHSDVKIGNSLVFLQDGKWRAELCDFGEAAVDPSKILVSVGFTPPEYIRFFKTYRSTEQGLMPFIQFNLAYGQKRDIWAMGLVLLSILVGRQQRVEWKEGEKTHYADVAPLPCLQKAIGSHAGQEYEEGILQLAQSTLDYEIGELKKEVMDNHPADGATVEMLFKIVQQMLKIDPEQRKLTGELLPQLLPQA